jgi:hypothetical protein
VRCILFDHLACWLELPGFNINLMKNSIVVGDHMPNALSAIPGLAPMQDAMRSSLHFL